MDARAALEAVAEFIETRANGLDFDEETQESLLDDITARFETALAGK